ncbi:class I SAM-dependent methyltransferase [Bowmanella denitrificans]|uniref:class I SAM-dependent methyltransferase n=1 Tax=Bowmanella denitrificans TaxID=366582 RepID=UPI000C9C3CB7|nr:class I SAM-dependent methyltransferase [Bowmanella denitrificans]
MSKLFPTEVSDSIPKIGISVKSSQYQKQLQKQLWEAEYGISATIPSSHRRSPSHAIQAALPLLNERTGKALDLGCGNGRNSFYLAENGYDVTGVDFSENALMLARKYFSGKGNIRFFEQDLCEGFPFDDNQFDFLIDSYCLCHILDSSELIKILSECKRVLKPDGKMLKIHLDADDEYYLQRKESDFEYGFISLDGANGIRKMHFTENSFRKMMKGIFEIENVEKVSFYDSVRGEVHKRSVTFFLMRNM